MTYLILQGDVIERLRELPDGHFHCCVTSPPYWGLRDYGVAGQIGREASPEKYIERMVGVFREVRRVLREDSTTWVSIGDSYVDKNLVGIPWRLVLALQADNWWWRSCIAWTKRNAMPESVCDRPTSSWEPIFLLTKEKRYSYDAEAVRTKHKRPWWNESVGPGHMIPGRNDGGVRQGSNESSGANLHNMWPIEDEYVEWNLGSEPFRGAHFAVFPSEIPRRAILASTSAKGSCPKCGAPWAREIDTHYKNPGNRTTNGPRNLERRHETAAFAVRLERRTTTTGWHPTCVHDLTSVPCRVLDPFGGTMTTALVAEQLGRDSTMIELSAEYCAMGEKRVQASLPLTQRKPGTTEGLPLFDLRHTDG